MPIWQPVKSGDVTVPPGSPKSLRAWAFAIAKEMQRPPTHPVTITAGPVEGDAYVYFDLDWGINNELDIIWDTVHVPPHTTLCTCAAPFPWVHRSVGIRVPRTLILPDPEEAKTCDACINVTLTLSAFACCAAAWITFLLMD